MRRQLRLVLALALGAAVTTSVVAPAQAASAGVLDGDVTNRLSSTYTVKVATFSGSNLTEKCPATNGTTYSCRTYWLPNGRADDQINGRNWDTDALMVESPYRVYSWTGTYQNVPAFRWYKISDGDNRTCELTSNTPACFAY
ncbi:hypothetical protein ACFQX6_09200 [Streptosporangium lutulentum]